MRRQLNSRLLKYLLLAFLLISGCGGSGDEREKITSRISALNEADNKADLAGILACYADSIIFSTPGKNDLRGKPAIEKNYVQLFSTNRLDIKIGISTIKIESDSATVWGLVTGKRISNDQTTSSINDQYIMSLSKSNSGDWVITRLVWWPASNQD